MRVKENECVLLLRLCRFSHYFMHTLLRSLYCAKDEFCFQTSKLRSEICKPFVKYSSVANDKILFVFLFLILTSCIFILFTDILYLFFTDKSGPKQSNAKTLWSFVFIYAAGFSALIHQTFDPLLFCAMNFDEFLCQDRPVLLENVSFNPENSAPLLRSSPCRFEVNRFVLGLFFNICYIIAKQFRLSCK